MEGAKKLSHRNKTASKAENVGFKATQVNPVQNLIVKLIKELKNSEFEQFERAMRDKLSPDAWSEIELEGYASTTEAEITQQRSRFFDALKKEYGVNDMLLLIEKIAKVEHIHIENGQTALWNEARRVLQQVSH